MSGPLSGVRIIDLTVAAAGPWATAILASQGADVIKVERPGAGDLMRWIGPRVNDVAGLFAGWNRGKRSVCIDLKQPQGAALVRKLVETADVFVHNLRPGNAEELGLGYEDLRKVKDDLIYAMLTGWGERGPRAGEPAYDTVIQAAAGFATMEADPVTQEPRFAQHGVCDKLSALTLSQLLTAALYARARTGKGQRLHVSMLHMALAFIWPDGSMGTNFLDHPNIGGQTKTPPLRKVADGWMAFTMNQDTEFQRVCRALGVEHLIHDPRYATVADRALNRDSLNAEMASLLAKRTTADLAARFTANRVPHTVVNSLNRVHEDPQVVANDILEIMNDPDAGRIRMTRPVGDFEGTPLESPSPAPRLGEHTIEVLRSIGLSEARIDELRGSGAVA